MNKKLKLLFLILIHTVQCPGIASTNDDKPFVIAHIMGQLGNNFFQVATASALAWDNDANAYFPDWDSNNNIYKHVFFRFDNSQPTNSTTYFWNEPVYSYRPIPYEPNMQICGYFQSEKYFAHHREKLLELFAPHPDDLAYIQENYHNILSHPNTVGIQLRYYKWEFPTDDLYPQYGKDYLKKAMTYFPKSSLFVVSSNNLEYAKKSIPKGTQNVIFLKGEPHYIDFFILSMCQNNIITNSSFGWWCAWLNQNPNKIVVRPSYWIRDLPTEDVCPHEWISIASKYE